MKRKLIPLVAILAMASLVSCAETPQTTELNIVASTDVYGSVATAIAGSHATVTSIIDSASQDPHEFEATARTQLALSHADVVIVNGGGYDDFMDVLLSGANNSTAKVLNAVELSGKSSADIQANEHVWYDLAAVRKLADALTETLVGIDPTNAADYQSNARTFNGDVEGLQERVAAIAAANTGKEVLVTEPVPLYLLASAGLTNATPDEFSTAIENGQGVAPTLMKQVIDLLDSGQIALLAYNEQTEGPETAQLVNAATVSGVPAIPVTETLPVGRDYLQWMGDNITAIGDALL